MSITDSGDAVGDGGIVQSDTGGPGATTGTGGGDFGEHFVIDPATITGKGGAGKDDSGDGRTKRRGRPRGSRNSGTNKTASLDLDGLSATLFSLHMMGASLLSSPTLALEEDESKNLAKAIKNVQRHYDMPITEKALDWMNLFGVMGMVYGPRIFVARAKRKEAKDAAKANGAAGEPVMTANGFAFSGMPQGVQQ